MIEQNLGIIKTSLFEQQDQVMEENPYYLNNLIISTKTQFQTQKAMKINWKCIIGPSYLRINKKRSKGIHASFDKI
jgi:hypothetical protein